MRTEEIIRRAHERRERENEIMENARGYAARIMEHLDSMASPNEIDRQAVRDAFKRWAHPQTAIALLHMGYDRDMVREEFRGVLELLDRVDESVGAP